MNHPQDDGLFVVDVKSRNAKTDRVVPQMRDALVKKYPHIDDRALFLNHTLWNREGRPHLLLRARGLQRSETACERADDGEAGRHGARRAAHLHRRSSGMGFRSRMIGRVEDKLVLYDTLKQEIVGCDRRAGDVPRSRRGHRALARRPMDRQRRADRCDDALHDLRRADRTFIKTEDFSRAGLRGGDLRIDPAPCWNRAGDRFAFPALAKDGTRQMFEVRVIAK